MICSEAMSALGAAIRVQAEVEMGCRRKPFMLQLITIYVFILASDCYEKTLRKIVRNQSKMVQTPFSSSNADFRLSNRSRHIPQQFMFPGYTQVKSVIHKMKRPKISTILSSIDTGRSKSMYSRLNVSKHENVKPYELRMARDAIVEVIRQNEDNFIFGDSDSASLSDNDTEVKLSNAIPISRFFTALEEPNQRDAETPNDNSVSIPEKSIHEVRNNIFVNSTQVSNESTALNDTLDMNLYNNEISKVNKSSNIDTEKADYVIEGAPAAVSFSSYYNTTEAVPYICTALHQTKADIDAQEKFSNLDIEPAWTIRRQFWNEIYESRYESLMRSQKWPPLKVILIPRSQIHSVWRRSFESLHNDTVRRIISNIVKKLQFYPNLTFSWNEVSHLSQWWKGARQKTRAAVRRLIKEGRLEITSGTWVETDESVSHLFGIIHQLIEGHQWLRHHLNYSPDSAWLTSSVTHSPTMAYLLSASGITNLVLTNLHYSWQQYLTEYQYTDFVWVQNWDHDKNTNTNLNEALKRIGNDRYPKHSVLAHYLQFNCADFRACGPQGEICGTEFNFANIDNNLDINLFNVKEKSERLLEQYSKTGTTSTHNVVIAPLGDSFSYEFQTEFDFQFANYDRIVDFVNNNQDIYKASLEFGTTKDYFNSIISSQTSFPTLKGDFLNFADISDGSPAYWTGFFTSRPQFKILLRRLQSTLRSTEILFSFAVNHNTFKEYNASELFELLLNAREVVARLQDRNVVSGTLTSEAMRYVHAKILNTVKDCWRVQEVCASLLSMKEDQNKTYLEKYVYRDGEFVSSFKSITPGDQIYVFNSLNQERTEVVELLTRHHNVRIVDHNKKDVTIQINPIWKFNYENKIKISKQFFKITFVINVPPFTFKLFKIKKTFDSTLSASTIYCNVCHFDGTQNFSFDIRPIDEGDIQIENYRHRLIFDEFSGFLKTVVEKWTNTEKIVFVDFGAFRSSHKNSGMFLFNTNYTKPLEDILSPFTINPKSKTIIIISGTITTEVISIYGALLQHSVKIFNLINNPLSETIKLETKLDYEVSPKNRDLEIFISIQTDIANGNPPELTIDNNGFQYTSRHINVSRRIESNVYPMTNMIFIQDDKSRLTVVTDHAQGVTALQEGQVVVMLDRRILYDDGRGSREGLADSTATYHTHYILLENLIKPTDRYDNILSRNRLGLPSLSAIYLANTLNYLLDVFFISVREINFCHFVFRPLVKKSFPCDVSMINYRVILYRGHPAKYFPNTALMVLHRHSFTCLVNQATYLNCNGEEHLRLEKMFHNIAAVYQTNLVGTDEGVPVATLNHENFPPIEITTLRIHFGNESSK